MIKRKGCLYTILGFLLVIVCCWLWWEYFVWKHYPPKGKQYVPIVNPQPSYYLTINGYVDPSLKEALPVTFRANYYTTNKACEAYFSSGDAFEGIRSYRETNIYYDAQPDATGHFQLKIPLDKYLPGYCQWQPEVIEQLIHNIGFAEIPITYFSDDKKDIQNISGYQTYICTTQHSCVFSDRKEFNNTQVYYKHSYKFELKILRK